MRRWKLGRPLAVVVASLIAAVVVCALAWSPGEAGSVASDVIGVGTIMGNGTETGAATVGMAGEAATTAGDATAAWQDESASTAATEPYEPGVALVGIRAGATAGEVKAAIDTTAGVVAREVTDEDVARGFVEVALEPGTSVEDAVDALTATGDAVSGAQPNYAYTIMESDAAANTDAELAPATTNINDEGAPRQWALKSLNAYRAWDVARAATPKSGPAITVAVLDQGFNINHPDLAANVVAPYNAVSEGTSAEALAYGDHGTHVAGIVAAVADNEIGVAGVSYNAKVMPVRVSQDDGAMYTSTLVDAYHYLMEQASSYNVRVVNMSLGSYYPDSLLESAIDDASDAGIVTVASAGNINVIVPGSGPYFDCYPSDYERVVSVMNLAQEGNGVTLAKGSNYNGPGETDKNISAPGDNILSTYGSNLYAFMGGTSMAAPQVAGVVALEFAADPTLTAAEAREVLYSTATDLGDEGFDETYGYGEADAFAATRAALTLHETDEEREQRLSREVAEVRALIAALPDAAQLTLSDHVQIEDARLAYDLLDAAHQAQVDATRLVVAEQRLEALAEAAYDQVVALIAALPDKGDLTLADAAQVEAARAAYETLPIAWQDKVDLSRLTDAESRMEELKSCHFDINFLLDGEEWGDQSKDSWLTGVEPEPYGTFDLKITKDGDTVVDKQDITDYVGTIPLGATWRITNVRPTEGHVFGGAVGGTLEGTIGNEYSDKTFEVVLKFDTESDTPRHTLSIVADEGVTGITFADDPVPGLARTLMLAESDRIEFAAQISEGYQFNGIDVIEGDDTGYTLSPVPGESLTFGVVMGNGYLSLVVRARPVPTPAPTAHTATLVAGEGIDRLEVDGRQVRSVELAEGDFADITAVAAEGYVVSEWAIQGDHAGARVEELTTVAIEGHAAARLTMGAADVTLVVRARPVATPVPTAHTATLVAGEGVDRLEVDGRQARSVSLAEGDFADVTAVAAEGYVVSEWAIQGDPAGARVEELTTVAIEGHAAARLTMGRADVTLVVSARPVATPPDDTRPLDVNFLIDGEMAWNQSHGVVGTFDLTIVGPDGRLLYDGRGIDDFCGGLPVGATWEISNVIATDGYRFDGAVAGSLTGMVGADDDIEIVLAFTSVKPTTHTLSVAMSKSVRAIYAGNEVFLGTFDVTLAEGESLEFTIAMYDGQVLEQLYTLAGADTGFALDFLGREVESKYTYRLTMGTGDVTLAVKSTSAAPKRTATLSRGSYVDTFTVNGTTKAAATKVTLREGESVTVTANPKAGKAITGWKVAKGWTMEPVAGVANTWTLTAGTANATITPTGRVTRHTLRVTKGTGVQSVTINGRATTSLVLEEGQSASVGYVLKANYAFDGWVATKGADTGYQWMSVDYDQQAVGDVLPVGDFVVMGTGDLTLKATATKLAGGRLSVTKTAGIASATTGDGDTSVSFVRRGTRVALRAVVRDGYVFTGWKVTKGDATISNPSSPNATLTMGSGDATVRATVAPRHTLRLVRGTGIASFAVDGKTTQALTVSEGQRVTFTVTAQKGYQVASVMATLGGNSSGYALRRVSTRGNVSTYVLAMGTANVTLRATGARTA